MLDGRRFLIYACMQQNNPSCIISKIIADFRNDYSSKYGEKHSTVKGLQYFS